MSLSQLLRLACACLFQVKVNFCAMADIIVHMLASWCARVICWGLEFCSFSHALRSCSNLASSLRLGKLHDQDGMPWVTATRLSTAHRYTECYGTKHSPCLLLVDAPFVVVRKVTGLAGNLRDAGRQPGPDHFLEGSMAMIEITQACLHVVYRQEAIYAMTG